MTDVLTTIATANLTFKYFPLHFRCAEIIILTKSEKTGKVLHTLKAYRFIILFNFINKVIKKIINEHIAAVAEKYNLLSQSQMKNYFKHLTELII